MLRPWFPRYMSGVFQNVNNALQADNHYMKCSRSFLLQVREIFKHMCSTIPTSTGEMSRWKLKYIYLNMEFTGSQLYRTTQVWIPDKSTAVSIRGWFCLERSRLPNASINEEAKIARAKHRCRMASLTQTAISPQSRGEWTQSDEFTQENKG